jgi:hypothetical protein
MIQLLVTAIMTICGWPFLGQLTGRAKDGHAKRVEYERAWCGPDTPSKFCPIYDQISADRRRQRPTVPGSERVWEEVGSNLMKCAGRWSDLSKGAQYVKKRANEKKCILTRVEVLIDSYISYEKNLLSKMMFLCVLTLIFYLYLNNFFGFWDHVLSGL